MNREFPFVPKSNKGLLPGDFWAVPLSDGSYAAGRVLEIVGTGLGSRVMFTGGLMEWRGSVPPEAGALLRCGVLDRGSMHILAITRTGGAVLGNLPLDFEQTGAINGLYPVTGTWGFKYIEARAEYVFVRGKRSRT